MTSAATKTVAAITTIAIGRTVMAMTVVVVVVMARPGGTEKWSSIGVMLVLLLPLPPLPPLHECRRKLGG